MSIYNQDVGTFLRMTIVEAGAAVDLSAASEVVYLLRSPSGTVSEVTAEFVTDGTDGALEYQTVAALAEVGEWTYQGRATWADGTVLHTDRVTVNVKRADQ